MFEFLNTTWAQIVEANKGLNASRRGAIIAVAIVCFLGILSVAYMANKPDYQILFSGLDATDAQSVTQKLSEDGVPYRLEREGNAIMVPAGQVHKLRLALATEGLPSGGTIGFEIFDNSTFGMTEFVQKLNFKRALQGELARTISQLREIKSARVHIATPKKKIFATDKEDNPTATVVLKMAGRTRLKKGKVKSIAHLVASSVENLSPENVTIVDTEGTLLSGGEPSDETARLSSTQMEHRKTLEKGLEKRITSMLENVVGIGKIVTRVNADIDFTRTERTEKTFDPNSQVARSEQRSESKSMGAQSPFGVPGAQSNLPGGESSGVTSGKPATSNNTQETVNYEINEVVSHIVAPVGDIKRLSIAVIVDGKYETTDEGERQFIPRSDEEIKQLSDLISAAAGVDAKRGDVVTVKSSPFDNSRFADEIEEASTEADRQFYGEIIKYAGMGALAVIIFMFVLRPVMGWITATSRDMDSLRAFPQTVREVEEQLGVAATPDESIDYRAKVTQLFESDPKIAAEMVREWLRSKK